MRCLSTILVVFVVALVADSADERPKIIVELIVASGKAGAPGDVSDQRATSIGLNDSIRLSAETVSKEMCAPLAYRVP